MNAIEQHINALAGDFGDNCSIIVSDGNSIVVHKDMAICRSGDGFVFYPNTHDDNNPITFSIENVEKIEIVRAGIAVCVRV